MVNWEHPLYCNANWFQRQLARFGVFVMTSRRFVRLMELTKERSLEIIRLREELQRKKNG